eukprot:symbB.v1.2.010980.t1/scaffold725.1/size168906/6
MHVRTATDWFEAQCPATDDTDLDVDAQINRLEEASARLPAELMTLASVAGASVSAYAETEAASAYFLPAVWEAAQSKLPDHVCWICQSCQVNGATFVLGQNLSSKHLSGEGLFGLVTENQKASAAWFFRRKEEDKAESSVLTAIWDANPQVPRTYRFELGHASPQLWLGVPSMESSRDEVTFLGPTLTRLPLRYVSLRAIGLSYGKESPSLRTSFDFNSELPFGAAALLDSGAGAIRVGAGIWERIMLGMPSGCKQDDGGAIGCPCQEELPTISMSLETMATFRILGLDSGADIIVCVPPTAYVTRSSSRADWCELAIVNAGEHHTMFGMEAVVSASLVFDTVNRVVGVEPLLDASSTGQAVCSDPKNWWSTGRRFSPKRVVVALMIVTMIGSYVFVGFSQSRTAERLRALLDSVLGPGTFSSPSPSEERPTTQFMQMANRNPE